MEKIKKRLAKDGKKLTIISKRWENKNKNKKTIGKRLVINGKNQKLKNLKNFKIL